MRSGTASSLGSLSRRPSGRLSPDKRTTRTESDTLPDEFSHRTTAVGPVAVTPLLAFADRRAGRVLDQARETQHDDGWFHDDHGGSRTCQSTSRWSNGPTRESRTTAPLSTAR